MGLGAGRDQDLSVGDLIEVFWSGDNAFYKGRVTRSNKDGSWRVEYDDGDKEDLDMSTENWRRVGADVQKGVASATIGKTNVRHSELADAPEVDAVAMPKLDDAAAAAANRPVGNWGLAPSQRKKSLSPTRKPAESGSRDGLGKDPVVYLRTGDGVLVPPTSRGATSQSAMKVSSTAAGGSSAAERPKSKDSGMHVVSAPPPSLGKREPAVTSSDDVVMTDAALGDKRLSQIPSTVVNKATSSNPEARDQKQKKKSKSGSAKPATLMEGVSARAEASTSTSLTPPAPPVARPIDASRTEIKTSVAAPAVHAETGAKTAAAVTFVAKKVKPASDPGPTVGTTNKPSSASGAENSPQATIKKGGTGPVPKTDKVITFVAAAAGAAAVAAANRSVPMPQPSDHGFDLANNNDDDGYVTDMTDDSIGAEEVAAALGGDRPMSVATGAAALPEPTSARSLPQAGPNKRATTERGERDEQNLRVQKRQRTDSETNVVPDDDGDSESDGMLADAEAAAARRRAIERRMRGGVRTGMRGSMDRAPGSGSGRAPVETVRKRGPILHDDPSHGQGPAAQMAQTVEQRLEAIERSIAQLPQQMLHMLQGDTNSLGQNINRQHDGVLEQLEQARIEMRNFRQELRFAAMERSKDMENSLKDYMNVMLTSAVSEIVRQVSGSGAGRGHMMIGGSGGGGVALENGSPVGMMRGAPSGSRSGVMDSRRGSFDGPSPLLTARAPPMQQIPMYTNAPSGRGMAGGPIQNLMGPSVGRSGAAGGRSVSNTQGRVRNPSFSNMESRRMTGPPLSPEEVQACELKFQLTQLVARQVTVWLLETPHECQMYNRVRWAKEMSTTCLRQVAEQLRLFGSFEHAHKTLSTSLGNDAVELAWFLHPADAKSLSHARRSYAAWDPPPRDDEWAIEEVLLQELSERFHIARSSYELKPTDTALTAAVAVTRLASSDEIYRDPGVGISSGAGARASGGQSGSGGVGEPSASAGPAMQARQESGQQMRGAGGHGMAASGSAKTRVFTYRRNGQIVRSSSPPQRNDVLIAYDG